jgi:hypothetical protein
MDTIAKENKLKENSEKGCFFNGLSVKINNIIENNNYEFLGDTPVSTDDNNNDNNNDNKIGPLHYIVFLALLLYLIYLFC